MRVYFLYTKYVYVFTVTVYLFTFLYTLCLQKRLLVYKHVNMLIQSYVYEFVIVVNKVVYNDYIMFTILYIHFFSNRLLWNLSIFYKLKLEKLDTYFHLLLI